MNKATRYAPEVRERAVRLVFEHQGEHDSQWAAIGSIASKMGCTAETLRKWVHQAERDQGKRSGLSSSERDRLKELERENRELKRANEILRKASALAGAEPSVGSVGDSYDNALAETIIGLYKTEIIHRRGQWRHLEAVEYATLEWVDWFNHRRLLEPIGNVPPVEFEATYYHSTSQLPMAA